MQGEWIVHIPYGTPKVFKRETKMWNSMTYINMQESQAAVAMAKMVWEKI